MIQKRTMMCGSAQPFFSKWWWIGAIRKTRLPNSLKRRTCVMTLTASTTKMPPSRTLKQLVLGEHREHAEPAAERERAHVAHEHLRGIRVVPEEADAGADHGAAVDGELGHLGDAGDVEVVGERASEQAPSRRGTPRSGRCRR